MWKLVMQPASPKEGHTVTRTKTTTSSRSSRPLHPHSVLHPSQLTRLCQPDHSLLHTRRDQGPVFGPYPLHDQGPAVFGPRALNLRQQPLVCPERPRVVEVDGVIQTDH